MAQLFVEHLASPTITTKIKNYLTAPFVFKKIIQKGAALLCEHS